MSDYQRRKDEQQNRSLDPKLNAHMKSKMKIPKTIRLNWKRRRQIRKNKKKMETHNQKNKKISTPKQSNGNTKAVQSLGRNRLKSRYEVENLFLSVNKC